MNLWGKGISNAKPRFSLNGGLCKKKYQENIHLVRQPVYICNNVIIFTKELALKTGNYTINTKFWHIK